MDILFKDLRYAIRGLLKRPVFTIMAVTTLALGIGANTTIFSVVNGVLLRPIPYQDSERMVWTWGRFRLGNQAAVSPGDFQDYRAQNNVFESWGAIGVSTLLFNFSGNERPEQVKGALVTSGFFEALNIHPQFGRTFVAADEQVKEPQVVIVGQRLWRERFGSDPNIVGKSVTIDGAGRTVVGVLPVDLPLFSVADVWVPAPFQNPQMTSRRAHFLRPIGLLKPGVGLPQAQADLDVISKRIASQYPELAADGWTVYLVPLQTALVGDVRQPLLILFAAVALVLLIACANVASLLLARNTSRRKEIAIRSALGAGRLTLLRQLLIESLLLSSGGAGVGIFLANAGVQLLRKLEPTGLPRLDEIRIDVRVLLFTAGVAVLTGLLFGLGPAIQASNRRLTENLKEGGSSGHSKARQRANNTLVIAEVGISLVVLIAAGLLLNSFWRLTRVNPGFDPSNVSTASISLVYEKYQEPAKRVHFFEELQEQLSALPGVEAAGLVSELPLTGQANDTFFTIKEHPAENQDQKNDEDIRVIGGNYLTAMRLPLIAGRAFTRQDSQGAPPVILINRPFAEKYFANENPIGKHLEVFEGPKEFVTREIVGIVGGNKHFALQERPRAEMFVPYSQTPYFNMNLVFRSSVELGALAPSIRATVRTVDPEEAISQFRTMNDVVASSVSSERLNTYVLGVFGGIALILTVAGIFGVLSYLVTQRTREIGLRMALGARRFDVLWLIVGHGMRLALVGVAVGLAGAFVVTRWLSTFLFGVTPTDPMTIAGVSVLLSTAAFAACYIPARRAARVDPLIALRDE